MLYELYYYSDEILKCCNICQPFSQIPSQKAIHDGNKLLTHPFLPIIWLSKAKYIANRHQAPSYFFFLSVEHREVYHKVYLKAFQNHMSLQGFIQAHLSTAIFPQRFSFFTVCLVNYLHKVLPWLVPNGTFLKFRSPDCWNLHFQHSFWLQKHSLYIICLQCQQFFLKF